jgi:hypothetical protein
MSRSRPQTTENKTPQSVSDLKGGSKPMLVDGGILNCLALVPLRQAGADSATEDF